MKWYITNIKNTRKFGESIQRKRFQCFSDIVFHDIIIDKKCIKFAIDGYVLPRNQYYEQYSKLKQPELIKNLFIRFGLEFIMCIKGVFNILFIAEESFWIFNDRHSIKKFFIYQRNSKYIVTNNLKFISENVKLHLDADGVVMFCLMEHFINGKTMFKNVAYSKPASQLFYSKSLQLNRYWYPDELINLKIINYTFDEIAEKWKTIIRQYVDYLKPESVTMTLTGGNDSRLILSALLNIGIKPNAFTFGDPYSFDSVIARELAQCVDLNFNNYYIGKPCVEWFEKYGNRIIEIGNSLINIHRAHRLDAIKREMENNPSNEMIFGGFMGGEYIKGINYDDYIIPKVFRKWEELNQQDLKKELLYISEEKNININLMEMNRIFNYLQNLKYLNHKDKKEREFFYLFYHYASIHHYQDSNIFMSYCKFVVNPYMDVDFLNVLFSSKYSMLNKSNFLKNRVKRFAQPRLHCEILHRLSPELSNIKFAKKGYYTVNEFLGNRIVYFFKRFYRYKIKKIAYPPNFTYRSWLREYIQQKLFNQKSKVLEFFSIKKLNDSFTESTNHHDEGYWHLFTNPINLIKNEKYYIDGDL